MNYNQNSDIIFSVTVEEVQDEAKRRIGRKLTDDEMHYAKKGIESGFSTGFLIIFWAAIDEAVRIIKKEEATKN